MNKRKVEYWNSLRKKLNVFVLIIAVLVLLLVFFIKKGLIINNLFDLFGLFVMVNLPLLLLEMTDRMLDLKEKKGLKKVFEYVMYGLIIFIPVIEFLIL